MKSLSIIILVLLQLCSNSKKEQEIVYPKTDTIIGKWQLYETCISPGTACEVKKIENGVILEFKADGSYLVTNASINDGYQCDGQWKILEIETLPVQKYLQLSPSCNKALWNMYFGFNANNSLNINPQCIEECRFTYKPI